MRLQEVEIEFFKGIRHAKFKVGPGGALFVGKSRSGKTRILDAVLAACKSKGFGPECITDGEDHWRVLLQFDEATVRTTVRRSGSKEVKVDGLGIGSPQAKLDAMIPDLIDPWKLALDKPEERRRKVLAAMFVPATTEDQRRWTGEDLPAPDSNKHGLDVVKELHDRFYEQRKAANKAVEDAEAAYKLAHDEAERLAKPEHKGVVVPKTGEEDVPVRAAEHAAEALEQRKQQAEAMAKRTGGTRARIAELETEADKIRDAGPMEPALREVENANARINLADVKIAELERQLEAARAEREESKKAYLALKEQERLANECTAREARKRQQARDLRVSLAETTLETPTAAELAAAADAITAARVHAELVRSARAAHDAQWKVVSLSEEVEAAKEEAKRLNDIVKRLDNEAPAELAARANMPPGVSFDSEDVCLDGKVFKVLSDSEKIDLCVDLVKRIAPGLKLLRIDEMEKFDPDLREDFIRRAKSGGWQILGTVVDRGEMRIVAIDADDDPEELDPKRRVKVLDEKDREIA